MQMIEILGLVAAGVGLTLLCVMVGAYVVFKAMRAVPGEKFLGGVPKGQVFSIPESTEEFPDSEKNVLEKTEKFLKTLTGA